MKNLSIYLLTMLVIPLSYMSWAHAEKHPTSRPTSKPAHAHHQTHAAQSKVKKGSKHKPPIDCPLRKQGINPHGLKPFKDIQKYIKMLERPSRALWQKPDAVVKALNLKGNEIVADVGAGSGYLTFRIAKKLPRGKVFAIDIEPEMIRHVHHKSMTKGIKNIHVVFAKRDDPKVPNSVNLVLICDVLHHVAKRRLWLGKLFKSLKKGAKVVIIEFKSGRLPKGPPEQVKIPKKKLVKLFSSIGFVKIGEKPNLLPYQEFIVFKKP